MKYGLIAANWGNIGDDIQSLATARLLPCVDYEIGREQFRDFAPNEPVKVICNGWWSHTETCWPPQPLVRPLLISMHLNATARRVFTAPSDTQPVGARDEDTLQWLQARNIPAYLSHCMTLTFAEYTGPRNDTIICVDVDPSIVRQLNKPAQFVQHYRPEITQLPAYRRRELAQELLQRYAQASLVITSRLHCALPCTALGTPVIVLPPANGRDRFSGFEQFLFTPTRDQLRTLDFTAIPRFDVSAVRDKLKTACQQFIAAD